MSVVVDDNTRENQSPAVSKIEKTEVGGVYAQGAHPTNTKEALSRPLKMMEKISPQIAQAVTGLSTDMKTLDHEAFAKAHPVAVSIMQTPNLKGLVDGLSATVGTRETSQNTPNLPPTSGRGR